MGKDKKEETVKLNFWAMVRDLGLRAISTGTFAPFSLFVIVLVLVLKMPIQDISDLIRDVFTGSSVF